MTFVDPFSDDPERAPVFESGYEAGFSEPNELRLFNAYTSFSTSRRPDLGVRTNGN